MVLNTVPREKTRPTRSARARALPAPEDIGAQLDRILGHRDFEASARTRKFLRFVVEETLAGRNHRLKGYTIAVEVFGRGKDFDANVDPIVRIQAGRLRRALEHYYLVAGGEDPIVIGVPKGGYVPVFERQPGASARESGGSLFETVPTLPLGVSVAVLPLQEITPEADTTFFAAGLTEELCTELNRYQGLRVIPCRKELFAAGRVGDDRDLSRQLGVRFLLEGSVRRSEDVVRVAARLVDGPDGAQIWAEAYTRPLSAGSLIDIQEEIARKVSAAVGGEYGVIPHRIASEARNVTPVHLSTYEAVLCFYDYEITLSPEAGARCLTALQAAVEREPEYGAPWAALSQLMRNAHLLDLPGQEDPRGRMAEYAQKGATLTPQSQLTRGALAHSHFVLGERQAFERELEATLALNPGSPFYVGTAGYLLTLADEPERGQRLLEKAIAMNPCHPRWFTHGILVNHYLKGDYDCAYQETLKATFGIHFWGPLLRAAVLGQLGRTEEAGSAASELLDLVPDFESRARDLTSRPILSEAVVDALLDGLRKAGLRVKG